MKGSKMMENKVGKKTGYFRNLRHRLYVYRESYILIAPYTILFAMFVIVPVVASIALSFTDFNMVNTPKFVGLENFSRLFLDDDVFLIAVKNTMIFSFVTGPVCYFAALMLAWFINELSPVFRSFLTFIFYVPSIVGNAFFIWTYMFSADRYGLVNGLLLKLGIIREPIHWLTDSTYMLSIIIIVQMWMSLGAGFLSFIAGLQSVDKSLYEAGALDGIKSRWQELWHITLPSMKPQLMFGAVMQIATSFGVGSVCSALAGFPSTNYAAHTIVLHAEDVGTLRYEMGYASAVSVVLFIIMIISKTVIGAVLKED